MSDASRYEVGRTSWDVFLEGSVLHVRIAAPVTDWAAIFSSVSEGLNPRPDAVALPAEIPGGNSSDIEMVRTMWGFLMDLGFAVYREATPPAAVQPARQQRSRRTPDILRAAQRSDLLRGL